MPSRTSTRVTVDAREATRARVMPAFSSGVAADVSDAATAFLTALDTSLARAWREEDREWRREDRQWRREDLEFRVEERDWWELEHMHRDEQRKWRRQDVEQRVLENARWVWTRYVEKNRRDVEEKGEQLRTTSNLAALISGFAVVALVELQFSDPTVPATQSEWLIGAYALATAVTVALMLNSMVLCSFMLSNILRNGKTYVSEDEEAEFLYACRKFALGYKPGDTPPIPQRSFERYWETRCEASWRKAFRMFTYGVPMFVTTLTLSTWLKFWYSTITCCIVTGVSVVAVILWYQTQSVWGWHLMKRSEQTFSKSRYFPAEGLPFDWHARPRRKTSSKGGAGSDDASGNGVRGGVSTETSTRDEEFFGPSSPNSGAIAVEPASVTPTALRIKTALNRVTVDPPRDSPSAESDLERQFLQDSSPRAVETTRREFDKVGAKSRLVAARSSLAPN